MMYIIAVNNFVVFIFLCLKNFNIDYLKNNVLLVRPLCFSALQLYYVIVHYLSMKQVGRSSSIHISSIPFFKNSRLASKLPVQHLYF